MEEGLFAKDHGGKHSTQTPHVETVVILLKVDQKLGSFEIARCHANVVFRSRMVKLGQPPIDKTQLGMSVYMTTPGS